MKLTLFAVLVTLSCIPAVGSGQGVKPVIASASGVLADGSQVTISGTALRAEAKTGWLSHFGTTYPNAWNMSGANPDADGYYVAGYRAGTYDSNVHLMGSQSFKFHVAGTGEPYDRVGIHVTDTEFFVRTYVRWKLNSGAWPTAYIKMLMHYFDSGPWGIQPVQSSNGQLPTQFNVFYDGNNHLVNIPSGRLQYNRWYCIEQHLKLTSPNALDTWIDGVLVLSAVPSRTVVLGSYPNVELGVINAFGTSASFDLDHWVGSFVIGTSRIYPSALVEVGNSDNYATATKRAQALEHIADDQIDFTLDLTGLGAGPYYLWVTNNQRQVTAAFPLLGLKAPTNVRVVK